MSILQTMSKGYSRVWVKNYSDREDILVIIGVVLTALFMLAILSAVVPFVLWDINVGIALRFLLISLPPLPLWYWYLGRLKD